MNVLFITLSKIETIQTQGIYTDLLRQFVADGHRLYICTPIERREGRHTEYFIKDRVNILKIRTLNITKTNIIEKGIGTLLLEYQYKRAVKKHLCDIKFDLILYSTPPITLVSIIKYIKKRCNATCYLMLKDIFPQNAVDMGMFSKSHLLYKLFRNKERKLYAISDYIGCMSPANCNYVVANNLDVDSRKVEICPNSLQVVEKEPIDKTSIRERYGLPQNKRIFIYGGNLGKPQGVDFLLRVVESNLSNDKIYFLIIGSGTEYYKVEQWYQQQQPANIKLLTSLPVLEYDLLVRSCDVGMIFLDARFTIPNYPSRLLSYISNSIPVIFATDSHSDVGQIAVNNNYGLWSIHGDVKSFNDNAHSMLEMSDSQLLAMGNEGYRFFVEHYDVKRTYKTIISHIK